jgi:hypothetical protein
MTGKYIPTMTPNLRQTNATTIYSTNTKGILTGLKDEKDTVFIYSPADSHSSTAYRKYAKYKNERIQKEGDEDLDED